VLIDDRDPRVWQRAEVLDEVLRISRDPANRDNTRDAAAGVDERHGDRDDGHEGQAAEDDVGHDWPPQADGVDEVLAVATGGESRRG